MRAAQKSFFLVSITAILLLVNGCSGVPGGAQSASGTTGGPFTISGTISGLAGTGLVLQDNGTSTLPISANGSFVFGTAITSGGTYAVTVETQPSNPTQTCTVTGGNGTAMANVTAVVVSCTTNPVTATIGGTVSGLVANSSVILQDNGGDSLTITANGAFTFKTPVTGADIYAVTVNTQPTNPNQICTVTGGSGTATANVTNVAVNCVLSYSIGGTVTGVVGTGLILENSSDSEQLPISAANGNQAFTFKNLVPTGTAYTVSVLAQPTGPTQTCVVSPGTGSGTATANVTTVVITCPAVTYSIGGTIVGLAGVLPNNGPLTDNSFSLENVLGNTLIVTENGPFTFATPEALNDQYQVSVFTLPTTQSQGCTTWNYKGVVTMNVTSIVVDCAHNDWTWIDGTNLAGIAGTPQYGTFPTTAPTSLPNPYTNSPGGRYSAAGWSDKFGNLWLFGGEGFELQGNTAPDTLDAPMNDLWVCPIQGDQCEWQLVGAFDPTPVATTTVGALVIANAQTEDQGGIYSGAGAVPGGRYGAATWTDNSGNLWLFGGNGNNCCARGLLNDLWSFDASSYNPGGYSPLSGQPYTSTPGQWTYEGGTSQINQAGVYTGAAGTLVPGARVNAATWTDPSGNFWLFGGYGFDQNGNEGFLSDLWEYTAGHWVFVLGNKTFNQNGAYGTLGTASATNLPGGRHEAVTWADANGNLWLFGGEGEDMAGTANGILNDLWVYSIANNQWTWVTGSNMANQTGEYGLQPFVGPPSTTGAAGTVGLATGPTGTFPGSRWGAAGWVDKGGNFWLFGGWGLDSSGTNGNGALNDTWVYTPNATPGQAGTWTWVKGSNTGSQNGIYGDELRPYKTYEIWTPGGRSHATHFVDGNGQLWLFGGEGYDSTSTTGNGYLNDTWRYLPFQN